MKPIEFKIEWESPGSARGEELRATWARLSIAVRDRLVTQVFDHTLQTVRDGVYGPLYPVAEWIAVNWWALTQKDRNPQRNQLAFRQRHDLRCASEGYALPTLQFRSTGHTTEVRWEQFVARSQRVTFLPSGSARLATKEVWAELKRFVTSVVERLEAAGLHDTLLQTEWKECHRVSADEREFCEFAGALGLDPWDLTNSTEDAILKVTNDLPLTLRRDFALAADVSQLVHQHSWVLAGLKQAESVCRKLLILQRLREQVQANVLAGSDKRPWKIGYERADWLSQALDLDRSTPQLNLDDLCGQEGTATSVIGVVSRSPPAFDAVVSTTPEGFGLATGRPRAESQRFAFCRAVHEFVFAPSTGPVLLSDVADERQQQSRAFAAELLSPATKLKDSISSSQISVEEVEDLAEKFDVSSWVIRYQLKNHQLAHVGGCI